MICLRPNIVATGHYSHSRPGAARLSATQIEAQFISLKVINISRQLNSFITPQSIMAANDSPDPTNALVASGKSNEEEVNPVAPAPEPKLPSRKDASLKEFLSKMDDYAPIVSTSLRSSFSSSLIHLINFADS